MHTQTFNTVIHCLIVLPIFIFTLTTPQLSKAASPLQNYKVYNACDAYQNAEDEESNKKGEIACSLYLDMMFESYYYHWNFTEYFKDQDKKAAREVVAMAKYYNPFGCDMTGVWKSEFIDMYLAYMTGKPDLMEKSFFLTLIDVTESYCDELENKNTDYYLDDKDGRRKS